MVSDSVTAVTALKGKVDRAVLLSVKVNSVIEQILNILRTLLDKYAYIVDIVLVSAGYKSILDVQFVVCLLYTYPSPRDTEVSRMPSSA